MAATRVKTSPHTLAAWTAYSIEKKGQGRVDLNHLLLVPNRRGGNSKAL